MNQNNGFIVTDEIINRKKETNINIINPAPQNTTVFNIIFSNIEAVSYSGELKNFLLSCKER